MKKANDKDVPEDEMLLAEALAAVHSRGLRWAEWYPFVDQAGHETTESEAIGCCALGALVLANRARLSPGQCVSYRPRLSLVHMGNDSSADEWYGDDDGDDDGESLGWAFRCAMTQES